MGVRIVESMNKVSLPRYTVRVWRQEESDYEHKPGLYSDIEQVARANQWATISELAAKLAELPRVNAVEVLDWDLGGVVVYNDWP
jgi:hypothetical protein